MAENKTPQNRRSNYCRVYQPRGGRKYFGALVLGMMKNGKLQYVGHTGSGFNEQAIERTVEKLTPIITEQSPFEEKSKNQYACYLGKTKICLRSEVY